MGIKSIIGAIAVFAVSAQLHAAIIAHGTLTTDDTTDYITDTATGRLYKRFDAFNLSYADTLSAVSSGGIYEGWSIATSAVAEDFYRAATVGSTGSICDGPGYFGEGCGIITFWNDGDFGDSGDSSYDYFWHLSTVDTLDRDEFVLGLAEIHIGVIKDFDDWTDPGTSDFSIFMGIMPTNALLYKDGETVVPIPAAVWLFGSGLIGLVGLARRKGNA